MRVTVSDHKVSGLLVKQPDGKSAWLPHEEISYERSFDPLDVTKIRRDYPRGRSIEAVVIGKAASEDTLPVVSVAAAIHDPWEHEVPDWLAQRATAVMVVTETGLAQYYRGQLAPGIEGRIRKDDWQRALGERAGNPFYDPLVGDRMAGVIVEEKRDARFVVLRPTALFPGENSEKYGDAQDPAESATVVDQAFGLLSETTDRAFLELNNQHAPTDRESTHRPSTESIGPILILDDSETVANCLRTYLAVEGLNATSCSRVAEARETLGLVTDPETKQVDIQKDPDVDPVSVALIDVNLEDDPDGGKYGGIEFARELLQAYPHCRVIFISGEPLHDSPFQGKSKAAQGLQISGFLFKPIEGRALLTALQHALTERARTAADVFGEQVQTRPAASPAPDSSAVHQASAHEEECKKSIEEVLSSLGRDLGADSVFLFSMHPVTYKTEVLGQYGRCLEDLARFGRKLRFSPVRDVCLGNDNSFYHGDVSAFFGKHRYLLYCYSTPEGTCRECRQHYWGVPCRRHRYQSCAAVPVRGGPGNPLAYALFAISMRRGAFDHVSILPRMELAGAKVYDALREFRQEVIDEQNFPFLMCGRSACSLGHDLCNYLQHGIDFETSLRLVEKVRSGQATDADIVTLSDVLHEAREQLEFASGIAQSFRNLSRDQDEPICNVRFRTILEGDLGAKSAAHPEIEAHKVEVRATRADESTRNLNAIQARRYAMVRVFQNLLNNSAQQSGDLGILPGSIRIDLSIRTRPNNEQEMLCVDVIDTGPGLHWADRHRIFQPRVSTREGGSGMGLHIVREEVQRVGGHVEVAESILGLGTRMRVWLPLADGSAVPADEDELHGDDTDKCAPRR